MCRWLAYSGSPVLIERLLYEPKHSLIDQSLHSRLGAETTNGDGFGIGWYGDGRDAWRLPQHRAGLERPEPPRARGPRRVAARVRAHSGGDRDPRSADELSSVPPRQVALDAQRRHLRPTGGQARSRAGGRPVPVPEIEGSTDSEIFFYLALTLGLEDDPPRAVAGRGRLHRGDRAAARRRAPDPDDRRDDGRREHLGVPLRERRPSALALLQHRAEDGPHALSGRHADFDDLDEESRLVVSEPLGEPRRRLERGARVELGRRSSPGGTSSTPSRRRG